VGLAQEWAQSDCGRHDGVVPDAGRSGLRALGVQKESVAHPKGASFGGALARRFLARMP